MISQCDLLFKTAALSVVTQIENASDHLETSLVRLIMQKHGLFPAQEL